MRQAAREGWELVARLDDRRAVLRLRTGDQARAEGTQGRAEILAPAA